MLVKVNHSGSVLNISESIYNSKKHLFTPIEGSNHSEEEGQPSDKSFSDTVKAVITPKKKK